VEGDIGGWYSVVAGGCPGGFVGVVGGLFGPFDGMLAFRVSDYGVSGFGHIKSSIEIGIEFNYI